MPILLCHCSHLPQNAYCEKYSSIHEHIGVSLDLKKYGVFVWLHFDTHLLKCYNQAVQLDRLDETMMSLYKGCISEWAKRPKGCALSKPRQYFCLGAQKKHFTFLLFDIFVSIFSIKFLKTKLTLRPNLNLVFKPLRLNTGSFVCGPRGNWQYDL